MAGGCAMRPWCCQTLAPACRDSLDSGSGFKCQEASGQKGRAQERCDDGVPVYAANCPKMVDDKEGLPSEPRLRGLLTELVLDLLQ